MILQTVLSFRACNALCQCILLHIFIFVHVYKFCMWMFAIVPSYVLELFRIWVYVCTFSRYDANWCLQLYAILNFLVDFLSVCVQNQIGIDVMCNEQIENSIRCIFHRHKWNSTQTAWHIAIHLASQWVYCCLNCMLLRLQLLAQPVLYDSFVICT